MLLFLFCFVLFYFLYGGVNFLVELFFVFVFVFLFCIFFFIYFFFQIYVRIIER